MKIKYILLLTCCVVFITGASAYAQDLSQNHRMRLGNPGWPGQMGTLQPQSQLETHKQALGSRFGLTAIVPILVGIPTGSVGLMLTIANTVVLANNHEREVKMGWGGFTIAWSVLGFAIDTYSTLLLLGDSSPGKAQNWAMLVLPTLAIHTANSVLGIVNVAQASRMTPRKPVDWSALTVMAREQ